MHIQGVPRMTFEAVLQSGVTNRSLRDFVFPFVERRHLLMAVDSSLVLLAAVGAILFWQQAFFFYSGITTVISYWYWVPLMLGSWLAFAWLNDLYDIPSSNGKALSAVRVTIVGALILGIYKGISALAPALPPTLMTYFVLLATPAICLWRWTYVALFNTAPFRHRVLVIGGNERGEFIANALKKLPSNYQVLGYPDLPYLLRKSRIHEIVVATKYELDGGLFQLLSDCRAQGVRITRAPDMYEHLYRRTPVQHIDTDWALDAMKDLPIYKIFPIAIKRLMDVVLGLMGLLFLAVIVPPVALAIRLDSAGPIFYRQTRCGRGGKPFTIVKFRTMCTDAEKDGQARWATKNDSRITRVGRFLRKTRLDEIPQIFNVLHGEMSMIGPRPERPEFVDELQREIPFYRTRLVTKPGLTGWAQVHYQYGNTVEDALVKLQYDFYYLRHWSVWLDLYVIFQTIAVVFKFKGT